MARSIKFESTVEMVSCMVCGKGGFDAVNPAVKYKGYTDHLNCFAKDFIKSFCKKNKNYVEPFDFKGLDDLMTLPKLNAAWASLSKIPNEEEHVPVISHAVSKSKLEAQLQDLIAEHPDIEVVSIFRKGMNTAFETRRTIHIVEVLEVREVPTAQEK
jgi:hypothetical protein